MDLLRKKAAQIIFPRLGSNMPPPVRVSEDFDRFRRLHEKYQFGGLVLFNGHHQHTPESLASLQRMSDKPLLVASDIERGAGQQIEGATLFPHAMACARAGTEAVAAFGRITAEEAIASGIHIAFAPVTDVNANPRNPIIGIRAFGSDPDTVALHVETYIRACRSAGLLTAAKHFPGHGDTATDSHAELPVVASARDALWQTELPPFQRAIAAGTDLIMTAHVSYPALDPANRPATRSRAILTDLLRDRMQFAGAIISDSLIMQAIQPADDTLAAFAADLLNAGLDILLDPLDPEAMLEAVVEAVRDGRVAMGVLDQAVSRVNTLRATLRARLGDDIFHHPPAGLTEKLGCEAHARQAAAIARAAITRVAGAPAFQPVHEVAGKTMALFVTPYQTRLDPAPAPVRDALAGLFPHMAYEALNADDPPADRERIVRKALESDKLLLFVVSRPAAWHSYGLPAHLYDTVQHLTRRVPTTLVALGDPHLLDAYPDAAVRLSTCSDVPASQRAVVRYLLEEN